MTTKTERGQFEAWVSDGVGRPDFSRHRDGYRDIVIDAMWDGWQARASQVAAPPAPPDEPLIDGYPLWSGIPQPVRADLATPDLAAQLAAMTKERDIKNAVLAGLPEGAIDGGWTAAGICSYAKDIEEKLSKEERQFKNFHEMLCERFDYVHDPKDWKRDQLSLVEHIAKNIKYLAIPSGALGKLGKRLSEMLDGEDFANIEPLLFAATLAATAEQTSSEQARDAGMEDCARLLDITSSKIDAYAIDFDERAKVFAAALCGQLAKEIRTLKSGTELDVEIIPQPAEQAELSDADIDALWVGESLTVPQIVKRRAIVRTALAAAKGEQS